MATELLRASGYDSPIYMLTAETDAKILQHCNDIGANGSIDKPISREKLFSVLSKHLNSSVVASSQCNNSDNAMSDNNQFLTDPDMLPILDQFINELSVVVDNIDAALGVSDWSELQSICHQLKGSGGSFGYPELTKHSDRLEELVKSKHYENVHVYVADLRISIDAIVAQHKESRMNQLNMQKDVPNV